MTAMSFCGSFFKTMKFTIIRRVFVKIIIKSGIIVSLIISLFYSPTLSKAKERDPFANYKNMYDYASVFKYRVIDKVMYFQSNGESGRYARAMNPKRINPYVRSQIYDATVSLLHGKYYTWTSYLPKNDGIPSRAFVSFSPSEAYAWSGSVAFLYIFYDEEPSVYNSFLRLDVNGLWYTDVSEIKKDYAEDIYRKKLEKSIHAIFDDNVEKQIFNFVFSEYVQSAKGLTKNGTIKKRTYGNINIVMKHFIGIPIFYFSYVKKPKV
jgi:hypothetical protein